MNAAISRSLPTGPQSLDTGLQKRAAGEAGSPAFEEALQENQKAKGDPERKAGDEETGWHPIRWTLPHRMGGQEGAPRDEEQPADGIEISLPEDHPSDQMRATSPEAGDRPTPVAADPEAVEDDGKQALNGESRAAQANGAPNAALQPQNMLQLHLTLQPGSRHPRQMNGPGSARLRQPRAGLNAPLPKPHRRQ
ncbi:hypothetical protein A33O_10938 [Nitratireductor aquibiodomus RA22]|uniref:Uncharacterized protein n=1 Tax=Nitratireductor aquibiodomus RA22 TaxID=1189611 RepID=I5BYM9_9HYPH|nr:hypothetical protein [Nitratireductor aquibiodomus]EIM74681.1 hypothetical protein A33O_10938 [Nitratireductor aquibiodomus RA22]